MKIMRKATALLLIAILVVVQHTPLQAQSSQADERITLSPAVSKPMLTAGGSREDSLKVINDGTVDYTFTAYSAPFSVKDESYDPDFVTVNDRTRAFEWVRFEKANFTLQAGEQVDIPYTITVPENAAPGGHYAVLFVETQPKQGSQIARKKRVGNLMYLTVEGNVEISGRVKGGEVPFFNAKPPITTDIRIENTGNTHFDGKVSTVYEGLFGKKHLTYNQEVIIMPGTTRRVPIAWENPPYLGIFKVKSEVQYLDKTEQLPTKYILILPYPVIAAVMTALLLALAIAIAKKTRAGKGNQSANRTKTDK